MERDLTEVLEDTIAGSNVLERLAKGLNGLTTRLFVDSPLRPLKTFLNGTWLEHPLHPLLTDVPIGAWTIALLLDGIDAMQGESNFGKTSGLANGFGALGATGAIITGLMDYTDTDSADATIGLTHGVTNILATTLFATSFLWRWHDNWKTRSSHFVLSGLGYLTITAGAYLGGSLVFRRGVMVNRNAFREGPKQFTPAVLLTDLPEDKPKRVDVKGQPVLFVRRGEKVYAIGAVCSHLGGPLEKGKIQGNTVECPWHYSVYSIEDGSYKSGPTTAPVPLYETRVNNGQVEIRLVKGV